MKTRDDLVNEIAAVINRANRESASDTPDFIIAEYMVAALENFEAASRSREKWYGREVKELEGDQA